MALQPTLLYCDHHEITLPPGHKFPMTKYRLLREELACDGTFRFEPAPAAPLEAIHRVHAADYVHHFLNGTLSPAAIRRIGFPWSESLVARTLSSVGGTLLASETALETGWGGVLAGGTHHAFHSEGSGFCVFNDIAVAITATLERSRIRRAAVVDLDVHQGDGTAALFATTQEVFTLSVHGRDNFPLRKQQSSMDVALPDATDDGAYLDALGAALIPVWAFAPDLIVYQAGVDVLATDKLGRLNLTPRGVAQRDQMVLEGCRERGIPCCIVLGGGYSEPVSLTVEAHASVFRTAARLFR